MGLMADINRAYAYMQGSTQFQAWIGSGVTPASRLFKFTVSADEIVSLPRVLAIYQGADYGREMEAFDGYVTAGSIVLHFDQEITSGQTKNQAIVSLAGSVDSILGEMEAQSSYPITQWAIDSEDPQVITTSSTREAVMMRVLIQPQTH